MNKQIHVELYQISAKSSGGYYTELRKVAFSDDPHGGKASDKIVRYTKDLSEKNNREMKFELIWQGKVDYNEELSENVTSSGNFSSSSDETVIVHTPNITFDEETLKKEDRKLYPRGWHFRKEFVDKSGRVFHKGEEQPDLRGTLPPSDY